MCERVNLTRNLPCASLSLFSLSLHTHMDVAQYFMMVDIFKGLGFTDEEAHTKALGFVQGTHASSTPNGGVISKLHTECVECMPSWATVGSIGVANNFDISFYDRWVRVVTERGTPAVLDDASGLTFLDEDAEESIVEQIARMVVDKKRTADLRELDE